MTTPINIDEKFPPADTDPIDLQDEVELDQVRLRAELINDGVCLRLTTTVGARHGNGELMRVPVELNEEDTERLYGLAYAAVAKQIEDKRAEAAPRPRLPKVIDSYDLAEPVPDPLIILKAGRSRLVDYRYESRPGYVGDNTIYVATLDVHRSECAKVALQRTDLEFYPHGTNKKGRTGDWPDLLPVVAKGDAVPRLCLTCKPLGKYSKIINTRTAWATFTDVPDNMPDHVYGFQGNREETASWALKRAVLRNLTGMSPTRWQALADLIEFAIQAGDES